MAYGNQRFIINRGSPINPILSRINLILHIDTYSYFFNINYNIILPHIRLGLPKGLFPVDKLKELRRN